MPKLTLKFRAQVIASVGFLILADALHALSEKCFNLSGSLEEASDREYWEHNPVCLECPWGEDRWTNPLV